jgi:hypothetical protein
MKTLLYAFLMLSFSALAAPAADELQHGFLQPPDGARPWVYWVWMDGNLSREGITADLEAMKRAGIGGVIIMEVNVSIPQGPVKFMSPEWRRDFTYVVHEAERLGIEVTLMAGPGWTGSGGPWVLPAQSMQHLVHSAIRVTGPAHCEDVLPQPARRPAFFGDGLLPADLETAKNAFYRDVCVLAYPTPKTQDTIAGIDEKAFYVRSPYSSWRGTPPYISSVADYPSSPGKGAIDPRGVIDISSAMTSDGRLAWDVPEGTWTVMRFGRTTTGANSRPAPVPGLGLESDKLDTVALNVHFEAFIGTLLHDIGPRTAAGSGGWNTIHMDSWEMGSQNWTPALRQEFRTRRGYDLLPYLPAISGAVVESPEVTERFLWDFRQTINEMMLAHHAEHLKDLGRRHGLGISIEPYDMTPLSDMSLGSLADVPMCEFWMYGFNTTFSVLEATSIAHTCERLVVAAESFTSSDEEHWQAYPGAMKALGDWAFCAGVNRLVFHRYQHQPWLTLKPGMTMGPYGVHWERTQTWWEMSPAYHTYLSRCQFMLRKGRPVADICYLVAEGAPEVFRPPSSAVRGSPPDRRGYNFDGCAPDVFLARMSVKDGMLALPGGMRYRVLVLPERETMTPALMSKVKQLVGEGATVIGPRPRKSPGLSGYPSCDREVEALAAEVWGDCDGVAITEHAFGKGRALWHRGAENDSVMSGNGAMEHEQYCRFADVAGGLAKMGVPQDFQSDALLRYTHRTDGESEIYFVANPEGRVVNARCLFRVQGRQPEIWDPLDGSTRDLPQFVMAGGTTSAFLHFEPHQSLFVIFRRNASQPAKGAVNFSLPETIAEVHGPWKVMFDTAWGGPGDVDFAFLTDWTRRPEEGIRYYSGTATYRVTFDLPAHAAVADSGHVPGRLWLVLGEVKYLAHVRLNGRDLGVVWCDPWRVEVGSCITPRDNRLEISVANLWPNRLIGDERFPADSKYSKEGNLAEWPDWISGKTPRPATGRLTFATWKHFTKDSPLLPSGLLGPVKLVRADQ